MSSAVVSDFTSISALFNLEILAIGGQRPTGAALVDAVKSDVCRALPVSKTAFFKYFAGNRALTNEQLDEVIDVLQTGVTKAIANAPDAALSYTHAAIICSSELASRTPA